MERDLFIEQDFVNKLKYVFLLGKLSGKKLHSVKDFGEVNGVIYRVRI